MDILNINNCRCGSSNVRMESFKNTHYGFLLKCADCKITMYDKAIPVQHPDSKNINILEKIQQSLVYKWNIESLKK